MPMPSISPTLIAFLALAALAGLLAGLLFGRRRRRPRPQALPEDWALAPRPVLSRQERRFHQRIADAFPSQLLLCKLPLVRFCQPMEAHRVRYWFDLLGACNVGFAVCNRQGRVILAIDLDDGREAAASRGVKIKTAVLAACHVRYLRCPPDRLPTVAELQHLLPVLPVLPAAQALSLPVTPSQPGSRPAAAASGRERVEPTLQDYAQEADVAQAQELQAEPGGGVVVDDEPETLEALRRAGRLPAAGSTLRH